MTTKQSVGNQGEGTCTHIWRIQFGHSFQTLTLDNWIFNNIIDINKQTNKKANNCSSRKRPKYHKKYVTIWTWKLRVFCKKLFGWVESSLNTMWVSCRNKRGPVLEWLWLHVILQVYVRWYWYKISCLISALCGLKCLWWSNINDKHFYYAGIINHETGACTVFILKGLLG